MFFLPFTKPRGCCDPLLEWLPTGTGLSRQRHPRALPTRSSHRPSSVLFCTPRCFIAPYWAAQAWPSQFGGDALSAPVGRWGQPEGPQSVPVSQVRESMAQWGTWRGRGTYPAVRCHGHLQQLAPYLLVQRTSHTQDLPHRYPDAGQGPCSNSQEHSPLLNSDELFGSGG